MADDRVLVSTSLAVLPGAPFTVDADGLWRHLWIGGAPGGVLVSFQDPADLRRLRDTLTAALGEAENKERGPGEPPQEKSSDG